eukprot:CAMPEP_0204564006 /NCGR_PEP_ID=MMETSP0661-20131031/34637_1 /ASSEMBLY_ACC=CAM_ASM_000606 /TAXON_ID=109239 /ORGANISM="Alexandrium margalefi, Strain AMGDE01CS-322" /LENGTH=135 /DNA_ID=CAMNT_0051571611 /DNA_START=54 /DNA_END=456 /DNA_ORIENTATION=-
MGSVFMRSWAASVCPPLSACLAARSSRGKVDAESPCMSRSAFAAEFGLAAAGLPEDPEDQDGEVDVESLCLSRSAFAAEFGLAAAGLPEEPEDQESGSGGVDEEGLRELLHLHVIMLVEQVQARQALTGAAARIR